MGDREANINRALSLLEQDPSIKITARSSFYATSPVDMLDQPEFLNNVVAILTELEPAAVHKRTRNIEQALNRLPRIPKGPRTIDIDLLTFEEKRLNTDDLQIPHRSMCKRKFVLVPLLEINPDGYCPVDQRPYKECLRSITDANQKVEIYHG